MGKTMFEKIWDAHAIGEAGGWTILYIDRHLSHDLHAKSLRAFQEKGIEVRRPDKMLIVLDHAIPTENQSLPLQDPETRELVDTIREFAPSRGIQFFDLGDPRNGISHIVAPEQGFTLPGITLVCGDSHTATHGAFGALAFGIGSSEVTHVMATQSLLQRKPATMLVKFNGRRPDKVYAKDFILNLIGKIGIGGGTGCVIEYGGDAVAAMSMEERMTLCNMTIEGGARAGMVAPDQTTYDYLKGRPFAPQGNDWEAALAHWKTLPSDPDAAFDKTVEVDVSRLAPQVTWGTNPGMVTSIDDAVPDPGDAADENQRSAWERALAYMELKPRTPMRDIPIDLVFIGSCTNSRIEDLREAAAYAKGRKVAGGVRAMVVPGSGLVRQQAEQEGLDRIFSEAGFEWREPGCSMCIAMNGDVLPVGKRSASTNNRNFEGRQGRGGRTHLVSPAMAAAAAVNGRFVDIREIEPAGGS